MNSLAARCRSDRDKLYSTAIESERPQTQRPMQTQFEHSDALLDEALGETFPASDPIALSFREKQAPGRAAPGASDLTSAGEATQGEVAAGKAAEQATIFSAEAVVIEALLPLRTKGS